MSPDVASLVTSLMTGANGLLALVVFALCVTLKQSLKGFFNTAVGQRLLPVLPLVLGVGLALLGLCTATRWQDRVIVGVLAGFAAAHVYKLGKDTVLGHNLGIDDDSAPTNTPPNPPAAGGT